MCISGPGLHGAEPPCLPCPRRALQIESHPMPHLRLAYLLPPDLEDPFVADLFAAGTLGVQAVAGADGRLRLSAWFPLGTDPELGDAWDDWAARGVEAAGR